MRTLVLCLLLVVGCKSDKEDEDKERTGPCATDALPELDFTTHAGLMVEPTSYDLPWDGSSRTVQMHVWYPTDDTTGVTPRYLDVFEDKQSFVDASYDPVSSKCTHPLVVWSHGSQAWAGNATSVLRQFINAGWIAAGPDHTGNTLSDNLDPRPRVFSLTRATDMIHTIDWIENLPEDHPLHGRVDTSRVLVAGHSFGGQTAWLMGGPSFDDDLIDAQCGSNPTCTKAERDAFRDPVVDERVVAVAPLAGTATSLVSPGGYKTLDVPVFYMTGSEDFDGSQAAADSKSADVTWVELQGACHESFTDTNVGCSTMPKELGLEITARYVTAFGTQTVLESDDPDVAGIVDGSIVVSNKVRFDP